MQSDVGRERVRYAPHHQDHAPAPCDMSRQCRLWWSLKSSAASRQNGGARQEETGATILTDTGHSRPHNNIQQAATDGDKQNVFTTGLQ